MTRLYDKNEDYKVPDWLNDPEQHIKVACRLCGDVWTFPKAYEQGFKKDPSWECPHCLWKLKMWGRN